MILYTLRELCSQHCKSHVSDIVRIRSKIQICSLLIFVTNAFEIIIFLWDTNILSFFFPLISTQILRWSLLTCIFVPAVQTAYLPRKLDAWPPIRFNVKQYEYFEYTPTCFNFDQHHFYRYQYLDFLKETNNCIYKHIEWPNFAHDPFLYANRLLA